LKKLFLVTLTILLTVFLCSCSCSHEWQEASCTTPQTCLQCGETIGGPLAHAWQEANCTSAKTCLLCNTTEGSPIPHEWIAASCVEPKTCFLCGTTDGNALGHNWMPATCTAPETCSACGEKRGTANGHILTETTVIEEASCTAPGSIEGTCSICQSVFIQEIPLLEHTPSDWKIMSEATYDNAGTTAILCTECGFVIEEKPYNLTEEEKEQWYRKACQTVSYDEIARNPNDYIGKRIKITGEVWFCGQEATNADEYSVYEVATKKLYGFYSEDCYCVIIYNYGQPRILSGDIITFYGEADGLMDIYGEALPCVNAIYYDIK